MTDSDLSSDPKPNPRRRPNPNPTGSVNKPKETGTLNKIFPSLLSLVTLPIPGRVSESHCPLSSPRSRNLITGNSFFFSLITLVECQKGVSDIGSAKLVLQRSHQHQQQDHPVKPLLPLSSSPPPMMATRTWDCYYGKNSVASGCRRKRLFYCRRTSSSSPRTTSTSACQLAPGGTSSALPNNSPSLLELGSLITPVLSEGGQIGISISSLFQREERLQENPNPNPNLCSVDRRLNLFPFPLHTSNWFIITSPLSFSAGSCLPIGAEGVPLETTGRSGDRSFYTIPIP